MELITLSTLTNAMTSTVALSLGAFLLSMFLTPFYTFLAYRYRFWKKQRSTSTSGEILKIFTKLHADKFKRNIPTMAGMIGVASITIITLAFNFDRAETWLPLAGLIGGGIVGLIDDIINLRGNGSGVAGMRSSAKFAMITALALALGWYFFTKLSYDSIHVPFFDDIMLGWLIVPIFAFAVVATGNAVNISDGLDGLAGGLLSLSFGAFGVIALLQGHFLLAGFCFTVTGALLSYLWFNIYPARFFMGDVGSFAFGVSLGVVAMMTNTLLLLPVIGIIFVVEAGSSLIQITSKKFFNRKVFVSAPIHHHLEANGWPETKITMRFWVIGWVAAFIGVYLAIAGGHI
jgi:phospho-N-acetylmuramoyl-pentapeptide-transferase